MPVRYEIDQEQKIIHTRCIGDASLPEVLEHLRALERDPACPDRLNVLLDLREMTSLPEGAQLRDVSGAIEQVSERIEFLHCAVVAEREVLFGMARMFEVFAEESFKRLRVFRTLEDAQEWLGLCMRSPRGR